MDMKNENKGDIMLSAICVDNQQDEESIMISSHNEKLRWWKLENIGMDTFQKPSDAMDALGNVECTRPVLAYEISIECDLTLVQGDVYLSDKSFYASLDTKCPFASDEAALGILRFIEGWYLLPVKIVGPATKEALQKVYDEGILDIGCSCFEEFYERYAPLADYELDIIVKPLVDIETFEGKVECDLVPVRYLFPMEMMECYNGEIKKA